MLIESNWSTQNDKRLKINPLIQLTYPHSLGMFGMY